jgi:hypothetical protein
VEVPALLRNQFTESEDEKQKNKTEWGTDSRFEDGSGKKNKERNFAWAKNKENLPLRFYRDAKRGPRTFFYQVWYVLVALSAREHLSFKC